MIKIIATIDPQVAFNILRAFCKLVHLARSTPPSLAFDPLVAFDAQVRECFASSIMQDLTDSAWQQAQLSLKYGGLGLRPVSLQSCATYIVSVCATGSAMQDKRYLTHAIDTFNALVSTEDTVTLDSMCHHLCTREPSRVAWTFSFLGLC